MNKKLVTLLLILHGTGLACTGQEKQLQFRSTNSLGISVGQYGVAIQLESVNGVRKGSWFAGIGLGLDHYRLQSIPLFADVKKEFGQSRNRIFIYGNTGINFSGASSKQYGNYDYFKLKFRNGFYGEAGSGYAISLQKRFSLSMAAGFTYKNTPEQYSNACLVCTMMMVGPAKIVRKNNEMNGIIIQSAIGF